MPSLLHISDLHRTSGPRVQNDELFAAVASDSKRWAAEGIPRPDLIVVSGDIVQGARADDPDADAKISTQYAEAGDLLRRLAAEFVAADPSRVVLVPGNHDVNWRRSRGAMTPLVECPADLARLALEPDSGIRWDWSAQQAYEIADHHLYESRLEQFREFRDAFYAGVDPSPLALGQDIVFYDYPDLDLAVVGFASWHGNDCFCDVGEIAMAKVALSRQALNGSNAPIAIAVWHHSVTGGPRARDYMDERVIHRLIDFGFSLGLHGHQHFPGAAPYEIRLPNETSMVVVSAGSLAVGDADLPAGERRQFNIIVVDAAAHRVTVHVREMSKEGVFSGSYRNDFGGRTSIGLPLPPSPARPSPPSATKRLDEAMTAVKRGQFETALELVAMVDAVRGREKRQVQEEALKGLGRTDDLIDLLTPPQGPDEAVRLVSILLDDDRPDEAEKAVESSKHILDPGLARDLSDTIKARRLVQ